MEDWRHLTKKFTVSDCSEPGMVFLIFFFSSSVLKVKVLVVELCRTFCYPINSSPASFHTPRPNLPVTPGVSWLPTFAFQSSIMKRTSLIVLVLEGLVGLHRTVQIQLLQHYWSGHRLEWLWYWMVCLGNKQRSFSCFWDCIQVLHFGLFCWLRWLFLLRDSCPQ